MYGVRITVEEIKGHCQANVKVGDSWTINAIDGALVMDDFKGCCPELLASILPNCFVMANDGSFSWEDEDGSVTSACPDPNNAVKVRVERIEEVS